MLLHLLGTHKNPGDCDTSRNDKKCLSIHSSFHIFSGSNDIQI